MLVCFCDNFEMYLIAKMYVCRLAGRAEHLHTASNICDYKPDGPLQATLLGRTSRILLMKKSKFVEERSRIGLLDSLNGKLTS